MERKYKVFIAENGHSGQCPNCGKEAARFILFTAIKKDSGKIVEGVDGAELNCCVSCAIGWRYGPSSFLSQHKLYQTNVDLHVI